MHNALKLNRVDELVTLAKVIAEAEPTPEQMANDLCEPEWHKEGEANIPEPRRRITGTLRGRW